MMKLSGLHLKPPISPFTLNSTVDMPRCAAMLAYGRKIVILPFRREANAPAEDPDRLIAEKNNPYPC